MLALEVLPFRFVPGLRRRKALEQVPRSRILRRARGALVEIARLHFHPRRLVTDALEPEILDQPHGPALIEAGHVFATDQRDRVTEAPAVLLDEPGPVVVFDSGDV